MIKGVIFDVGTTLVYLDGDGKELEARGNATLMSFLKKNGIQVGDDFPALLRRAREDGWRISEETGREHTIQEALHTALIESGCMPHDGFIDRCAEQFQSEGEIHWQHYPESLQALMTLKARGLRLGIISNTDDDATARRLISRLGLTAYFDPILTSAGGEKWRKPNPRVFQLVADQWHLPPDEIVMVGDSPRYDIVGAHRAGMRGILVDRHEGHWWQQVPQEVAEDPTIQPDATVNSLLEIPNVIDQW